MLMLQLRNIYKSFPGVIALQDVSLELKAGEVHALCGENGAGKSTLMNIIVGNIQPDKGSILVNEKNVVINNVEAAHELGISIVYQERSLAEALTIAENIFPVNQPLNSFGLISYKRLYDQTQRLLDELQLTRLSPGMKVARLSSAQKQMVEIAKALAKKPSVLILDEPTASITNTEAETLFAIIRKLKEKGVAIIYISHRMAEIIAIADVVSVLKDGCYQGTYLAAEISMETIITKMVGRSIQKAQHISHRQNDTALTIRNLSGRGFHHISLDLHKGEILGLAGLQGSGRTELALAIFGDAKYAEGDLLKEKTAVCINHPRKAVQHGIAYIPEDRKMQGLFLEMSISDNIMSAGLNTGIYKKKENDRIGEVYRDKLDIRATSIRQVVRSLSGGNQQKVVFAKWLHTQASILIVNEPTHGVDVGGKAEIYKELKNLTDAGKSILLISSELPELLLLSDRIAVMYNGVIQGILDQSNATEQNITAMASGV